MWPVYSDEIELYNKIGLEKFWHLEGWDRMNVARPRLKLANDKHDDGC
jgi:hypothetical protein